MRNLFDLLYTEAISEVFVRTFRSLTHQQKSNYRKLLSDLKLREDIVDIVSYLLRQKEKSIPYEKVKKNLKGVKKI